VTVSDSAGHAVASYPVMPRQPVGVVPDQGGSPWVTTAVNVETKAVSTPLSRRGQLSEISPDSTGPATLHVAAPAGIACLGGSRAFAGMAESADFG